MLISLELTRAVSSTCRVLLLDSAPVVCDSARQPRLILPRNFSWVWTLPIILLVTAVVVFLSPSLPTYVSLCLMGTLYILVTDLLLMAIVNILGCSSSLPYVR